MVYALRSRLVSWSTESNPEPLRLSSGRISADIGTPSPLLSAASAFSQFLLCETSQFTLFAKNFCKGSDEGGVTAVHGERHPARLDLEPRTAVLVGPGSSIQRGEGA